MDKQEETKQEVKCILESLQGMPINEISKKSGLLDFNKLEKREEVKKAITNLKKLEVDRAYLLKYFNIVGLTIGHLLK